ncbi:uncharacterized protein [Diadema antillarum]|uniref:uncharacterized protein n=1 Tax=Diadema antillarum TaxID=105358 RepID=UPI003A8B13E9
MSVKCYEGIPTVKLVDGSSPIEGLLVIESDRYVCLNGFTPKAAELVCEELGFPTVKNYTGQSLASIATTTRKRPQLLSCEDSLRVMDCLTVTECFSNRIVRLQCREPAFLGCYKDNQSNFQTAFNTGFGVDSESECMSTCRRQPESNGVAVMHEGLCICFQSETYAQIISGGNFSHNWVCPLATEADSNRHHSFNLSVGFCDHPGVVPNGSWDSDITSFGSKITLTCDKGYNVNGSAILQCVGLPGWSTYFPVWNVSAPSCQAVENAEWQDGNITTMPTQSIESTSQGQTQTTQAITSLRKTTEMSQPVPESDENNYTTYILGTLLVVFAVVGILSIAWCRHQQKRHWRSQTSHQPNVHPNGGQLQMNPIDTSVQEPITTDHTVLSDATNPNATTAGRFLPHNLGITVGDRGGHLAHTSHIYQDAEEIDEGLSTFTSTNHGFPCTVPDESHLNTGIGTSLISMNIPSDNEYCGLQETSLEQPACAYGDDNDYQAVDLCKLDRMTNSGIRSTGKACLLDDSYYNSLTLFPNSSEMTTESEYDRLNHAFPDDRTGSRNPGLSPIGQTSQHKIYPDRKYNKPCSSKDAMTAMPFEDVFYYQLNPEQQRDIDTNKQPRCPEAFDSGDYSLLNPEKDFANDLRPKMGEGDSFHGCHDTEIQNPESFTSRSQTREDMYATVNKTVGNISIVEPPPCEELYAQVDKTRGASRVESEPTMQEEIYMNFTNM